jgi:cathepsin B
MSSSCFLDVAALCGTVMAYEPEYRSLPETDLRAAAFVPESFNAAENWPACADLISTPRDQSACGSCWAFGATEAFNDRLCISKGFKQQLSVQDTTSCCGFLQCFSMGCNGGQPSGAWNWFVSAGVVTGGDFEHIGAGSTCKPYSM